MRGRSLGTSGTIGAGSVEVLSFDFTGSMSFGLSAGGMVVGPVAGAGMTAGADITGLLYTVPREPVQPLHAGTVAHPLDRLSRARRRENSPVRAAGAGSQQPLFPMAKLDRTAGPSHDGAA